MFSNDDVILGEDEGNNLLFVPDEPQTPEEPTEPVETQIEDPIAPIDPIEPTSIPTFDISEFNKAFNTSFGDAEALKSILGTNTKVEENNGSTERFLDLEAKHNKLIEEFKKLNNPLDFFSDELEAKKNVLIKSNSSLNKDVAGKVFSIDLQKDNPLDIIALNMMLNSKVFKSGEDAKALFLKQNDIDADFTLEDLDVTQRLSIDLEAEKAARNIEAIRSSVQMPQSTNIDELLAAASYDKEPEYDIAPWNDKIETLVSSIKDFEVKDEKGEVLFIETVDEEFKQGLDEVIKDTIRVGKMQPTEENVKTLTEEAIRIYKMENFDKIVRRVKAQVEAREADKYHKMIHNDIDPDRQVRSVPVSGKTTDLLDLWKLPK